MIGPRNEGGIGGTFQSRPDISAEVIDGADEVFVSHEDVGHEETKDDGADPGANEAFDGFLGGKFDELSTAKSDAAYVGEDVIGDDKADREEEPYHAFKDVVHDEMGLDDDQIEGHVCPSELGELESVVPFFKRADKEDEAHNVEHEADKAMVCCKG